MLYVVIHHCAAYDEEADVYDYLIGVFDNKESAKQAKENYFNDFPEIAEGLHSISITPIELNTYNDNLECNIPWENINGEWKEEEI